VLGPSEGGLGGQDAPDGFPASGRNAYLPGANAFFADVSCRLESGIAIFLNMYFMLCLLFLQVFLRVLKPNSYC